MAAYITINDLEGSGFAIAKSLGTLSAPTVSASGTGGTIPSGTYSVKIAALNLTVAGGYMLNYQVANLSIDTANGITVPTSEASISVTSGQNLSVTITPLAAAAAYAIFVGASGSETLQIITTAYQVTLTSLVTGGTAASGITADSSGDTVAINNICQWASDLVDGECRQSIGLVEDETEQLTVRVRDGRVKVFPRYLPIAAMTSLQIFYSDLTSAGTIAGANFRIISREGYAVAVAIVSDGEFEAELIYDHGFSVIPQDVKTATVLVAQLLLDKFYFAKIAEIAGAEQIKQGQLSISRKDEVELPDYAKSILDKYRRVR